MACGVLLVFVPVVEEFAVTAGNEVTTTAELSAEVFEVLVIVEDVFVPVVNDNEDEDADDDDDGVVVVLQGHCKVGRFEHRNVAVLWLLLLLLLLCLAFDELRLWCFVLLPGPALALLLVGVIVKEAGRLLVLTHNDADVVDAAEDDVAAEVTADEVDVMLV